MTRPLRITFLLPNRGAGGGVRAIKDFGNGLISLGHDVRIIYRDSSGEVDIFRRIYRKYFRESVDWLNYFQGKILSYKNTLIDIEFQENEIVISMCSQTTLDAYQLRDNVVKVMHCHGCEYEDWGRFMTAINLPVHKIAISQHVKTALEHYSQHKVIAVVPNGINHSEYYRSENITKNGVGGSIRTRYSKDPENTIRVFKTVHKELPHVPLYSFGIGKKPSIYPILNFTNNPSIEEARNIYNKCQVWFLTSIEEGFGLPVLEAMSCGAVVVSTRCGGPQDLIIDGYNGYNVEIGNHGAISCLINKILIDRELFQEMSANSIRTASQFTLEKSASKLEIALKSIPEVAAYCSI